MLLPDVNMLVYAFRTDAPQHERSKRWLSDVIADEQPYGLCDIVLSGFLRVVTNPRIFKTPTPQAGALAFVEASRSQGNCVVLAPGPRHWDIFMRLCKETRATGNTVPDAYLAALAIESGSEWITLDGGFARFQGLRWRRPF